MRRTTSRRDRWTAGWTAQAVQMRQLRPEPGRQDHRIGRVEGAIGPLDPVTIEAREHGPPRRVARPKSAPVTAVVESGDTAEFRESVIAGHPAQVLIDAAREAQLLVVGSRGHGGVAGALLGSVGQHCVQHATCPVVVVRGR
jgi:nucleotide-binding universal stress UspA family protein